MNDINFNRKDNPRSQKFICWGGGNKRTAGGGLSAAQRAAEQMDKTQKLGGQLEVSSAEIKISKKNRNLYLCGIYCNPAHTSPAHHPSNTKQAHTNQFDRNTNVFDFNSDQFDRQTDDYMLDTLIYGFDLY